MTAIRVLTDGKWKRRGRPDLTPAASGDALFPGTGTIPSPTTYPKG